MRLKSSTHTSSQPYDNPFCKKLGEVFCLFLLYLDFCWFFLVSTFFMFLDLSVFFLVFSVSPVFAKFVLGIGATSRTPQEEKGSPVCRIYVFFLCSLETVG